MAEKLDLTIDLSNTLEKLKRINETLQQIHLSEEECQKLKTESAKTVAELSSDFVNRLPALDTTAVKPQWAERPSLANADAQVKDYKRMIGATARITRISTDTPDQMHYKVFCNEKELKACIFADEPGNIAVCYQIQGNSLVRREDWSFKTIVHHGKIEIRRIEE